MKLTSNTQIRHVIGYSSRSFTDVSTIYVSAVDITNVSTKEFFDALYHFTWEPRIIVD